MPHDLTLLRRPFSEGIAENSNVGKWAELWLKFLIVQDGSATLICETIANGPVRLDIIHQETTTEVPDDIRAYLAGERFIERQVCISHQNEVMMDNLTYISLEQVDADIQKHLEESQSPIGYIFNAKLTRKRPVPSPESVLSLLWQRSGMPDPDAARSYILEVQNNSCMFITETFRSGMRYGLPLC